ncbi:hypothetical protein HRW23_22930 [Streptomyces lunaelactis]|uniref:hypothetical protein n=1 Tax=Streptomyces lunaelactis TaxID=1535768 RepID=UPI001584B814|nr:hypothetical protein [Streptomyces lunaelactis]NUK08708.1 hypothetical protein [Streptomyces lunaelactis]NUK58807.1 hypothetical protein [Streptomyces lunaelactis]NUK69625.1 hypothetical protein [Streptomyces lunaelactis]NUK80190.1 hypothetical protein [Streptomyces lunaelactis]NUL10129.1 hypothetical protein [Streptomyces lunaelactis]
MIATEGCPGEELAASKPGVTVQVDGKSITTGANGQGRDTVPPGNHTVTVAGPVVDIKVYATKDSGKFNTGGNGMIAAFDLKQVNPKSQSDYDVAVRVMAANCPAEGEPVEPGDPVEPGAPVEPGQPGQQP